MKFIRIAFVLQLLLSGCFSSDPVITWLNPAASIYVGQSVLNFKCEHDQWSAYLQNYVQPIPLPINYTNGTLSVSTKEIKGTIEGSGAILISNGSKTFYFPVFIFNHTSSIAKQVEFRSPKTVNPDSSLLQQKIIYRVDEHRNLTPLTKDRFFSEEFQQLNPKSGAFATEGKEPLKYYYVQPGTCTYIPIALQPKNNKDFTQIIVGPLKDNFGNAVSNGTNVKIVSTHHKVIANREVLVYDSYAYLDLPSKKGTQIFAQIDQFKSATLTIR